MPGRCHAMSAAVGLPLPLRRAQPPRRHSGFTRCHFFSAIFFFFTRAASVFAAIIFPSLKLIPRPRQASAHRHRVLTRGKRSSRHRHCRLQHTCVLRRCRHYFHAVDMPPPRLHRRAPDKPRGLIACSPRFFKDAVCFAKVSFAVVALLPTPLRRHAAAEYFITPAPARCFQHAQPEIDVSISSRLLFCYRSPLL